MMFPFYDELNAVAILCSHVINRDEPILFVLHDEDDRKLTARIGYKIASVWRSRLSRVARMRSACCRGLLKVL